MTDTRILHVSDVPVSTGVSAKWPNPIKADLFAGKSKGQLGKRVGLTQFGVNRVTLLPGSISSLRHWHQAEDEFVYVLEGELVMNTGFLFQA